MHGTAVRIAGHRPTLTPQAIGRAATLALHDELALSPKPGLVTLIDRGSHEDMDAHSFMRSLFALRHYFGQIAEAGLDGADFAVLERLGIAAEARMLAATEGVNTHRGAIFMLGLLCASAGAVTRECGGLTQPAQLRDALRRNWGEALVRRSQRMPTLPGGLAARRHGLRSASQEAALAFPALFETAVPALTAARARGLTPQQARLDTLFHIMAVLDDSNLAHRGGLRGLRYAQCTARQFLDGGGAAGPDGLRKAESIARAFVAQRLSPGGAADTLSAACWITRMCDGP
nr:triphosphoribosyl-dephospho-CoA synthase [uncultured Roseateles sp.]